LALGKEGYSTWWCSFCCLFKTSWQEPGHLPGEPWTLLGLKEHASKIENGETNVNNVQAVCGVREVPVFDAIDVDHYVIPSLHLLIGKGNDGLDNFFLEIQAAAESYTAEYHLAEKEVVQIAAELEGTRGDLGRFNTIHREYKKDLKQTKRQRNLSEDVCSTVEAELVFIDREQILLQNHVDQLRDRLKQSRQKFNDEKKKPENGKAFGQPLRANFGERNHQHEAKADRRIGAIRDYAKKEAFKSKDEVRKKNPKVEAKIAELKIKNKRKSNGEVEGRDAIKRQKRIEAREAALACPEPYDTMKTLREIRKETMKNN
jgi:hypothetical protein